MSKKDSFTKRAGNFFAGKGFYIVLILCVAVIGASAWAMLRSNNLTDDGEDESLTVSEDFYANEDLEETLADLEAAGTDEDDASEETALQDEETSLQDEETGLTEQETPVEEETETPAEAQSTWTETMAEPVEIQFVWPVSGEVEVPHSVDELIYDRTMGDWRTHDGIDITADLGESVMAVAAGTVTGVYQDELYGTTVVIDHGNEIQSMYSNLAETPTVSEGDWVESGAYIGSVGKTAIAETGIVSHLHLRIIDNGESVDPLDYLPER